MDFDEFLEKIGGFGKAQFIIFTVPALLCLTCAIHTISPVYLLYAPHHRCRLPATSPFSQNDSFTIQNELHQQQLLANLPLLTSGRNGSNKNDTSFISSTSFDKCRMIDSNNSTELVKCRDWVFDQTEFQETFVMKASLVCDNAAWTTAIGTSTFAGFLVGVLVCGIASDLLGRRPILIAMASLYAVAAVSAAFAQSPLFMSISRFLIGFGGIGAFTVGFVISTEIVPTRQRFHTGIAIEYFWVLGSLCLTGLAYGVRQWNHLQLILSATIVPILIASLIPLVVPESPRWLLAKGRYSEAKAIAMRMARLNSPAIGDEAAAAHMDAVIGSCIAVRAKDDVDADGCHGDGGGAGQKAGSRLCAKCAAVHLLVCKAPCLLLQFAVVCGNWLVISLVYYGLTMGAKNLPGSIYFTSLLNALVEVPAYLLGHVTVNRIGRKPVHIACMVMAGMAMLALLLVFLVAKELSWLIIFLSMTGKLFTTAAFAIVYLWTAELYPTNLRNFGVSISSMFARIGTLFAPVLADIKTYIAGDLGTVLAYAIFSSVTLAAAAAAMIVPETRGRRLYDSLQKMVDDGYGDSRYCCCHGDKEERSGTQTDKEQDFFTEYSSYL